LSSEKPIYAPTTFRTARVIPFGHETGIKLPSATGFFVRSEQNFTYLITNLHVVTAKHFFNGSNLAEGATPGKLRIEFLGLQDNPDGSFMFFELFWEISLRDDKGQQSWFDYTNTDSVKCDVAILPLCNSNQIGVEGKFYRIEAFEISNLLSRHVRPMDRVSIVGFPLLGNDHHPKTPIYKTAFVASEPYDTSSGEHFLVDGKTKGGMSGSPVILRPKDALEEFDFIIGCYSGRESTDDDLLKAELGFIWPFHTCIWPKIKLISNS